ncbi:class I SAM-dependent methyltransferase [Parahaliea mediterranea]|uniref:Class I SAM-dependent methyltransferase n=1 Tax=Parahaliea mediterranea TaxID=651086 RepID=A0A939DGZ1_9GAMM|nr:class I SAM-dependent methyltransferase [Parahaliea mediterranea]MBN7798049.1 class I SAM-dependent methyltransferase [Parahaliea mediterranea]
MAEPLAVMKGPHQSFLVRDVVALKPNHARVRQLRDSGVEPRDFGSRIWRSSYLLIDYLSRQSFRRSHHALELGCGWGLPSQFLQKQFGMRVTATDADDSVRQYLELLSEVNGTEVGFRQSSFEQLCNADLDSVDTLVGADICYRPDNGRDLLALVERFLAGSGRVRPGRSRPGRQVILADSGRDSFFELARQLGRRWPYQLHSLSLRLPAPVAGHVLHLGSC